MNKRNLFAKTGWSLSQAQSISNICHQRVLEIDAKIDAINNVSKTIKIDSEYLVETQAVPMPDDIVKYILIKGSLSATQAFLMEAIKAKEEMINTIKNSKFNISEFLKSNPQPEMEELDKPVMIPAKDESWGWEQLSLKELSEFWEAEAYASQIGKFIHKNGKLTNLRTELPKIKTLEWITVEEGKKTPVKVVIHHTPEQLMLIHENLAEKHREYESKVNYYKAKVKNLVTLQNAAIAKENTIALTKYNEDYDFIKNKYKGEYVSWRGELDKFTQNFEADKAEQLKEVLALRIVVDGRFQETINSILSSIKNGE